MNNDVVVEAPSVTATTEEIRYLLSAIALVATGWASDLGYDMDAEEAVEWALDDTGPIWKTYRRIRGGFP